MNPLSIAWQPTALGSGSVEVRWLGAAGFALCAEGTTLLLDPYLTRASLGACVTRELAPNERLLAQLLPEAHGIVLGHTHFDHALDAPSIARRTGARVFGSRSAAGLCRASGLPEAQIVDVESLARSEPFEAEVGPFRLRFHPSAHSRLLAGRVPFPGEISDCDQIPLRANHYKCGAVFGVEIRVRGKRIVHVGSAELVEDHLRDLRGDVDLALLCVAGWTSSRKFPERLVRALSPRAVLLSHWDDFFRPIGEPVRALPAMRVGALVDRLTAASRDCRVGTLPLLGDVRL